MTITLKILLCALASVMLVACATPEQTAAVATAGAGALIGFVDALRPMLSPEQAAKLSTIAGNVEGVVQATTSAVGAIAEAVASVRAQTQAVEDSAWTTENVALGGGGLATATAVGVNAYRNTTRSKALKEVAANGAKAGG